MFSYLQNLPVVLSFSLSVLIVLSIVLISLKGKAFVRWGKNLVGLGNGSEIAPGTETGTETNTSGVPQETTMIKVPPSTGPIRTPKRGCGDCILIIMGEREKYELNINKLNNRILKQQMNFVEQKLVEMQAMFISSFMEQLRLLNGRSSEDQYEVQYKLFYGLLKDCLLAIKDEFRRSMKENGFFEMESYEFDNYVKEKTKNATSIVVQHFRNLYPTRGIIVPVEKIVELTEKNSSSLQDNFLSIYVAAKQTIHECTSEMGQLEKQFSQWVDSFIKG